MEPIDGPVLGCVPLRHVGKLASAFVLLDLRQDSAPALTNNGFD